MSRVALVLILLAFAAEAALAAPRRLDVLLVVDDSGSMAEEQAMLAAELPALFTPLSADPASLHVAVITTDVGAGGYDISDCRGEGDDGRFHNQPLPQECRPLPLYLADLEAEGGGKNFDVTLRQALSCLVRVGIDGCGFEQPLEAMRRALDGRHAESSGFLRDDAVLLVLFLTDEDDCSAFDESLFDPSQTDLLDPLGPLGSFRCTEQGVVCGDPPQPVSRVAAEYELCAPRLGSEYLEHPAEYVGFLRSLKANPARVVVASIAGDASPFAVAYDRQGRSVLQPSCRAGETEAAPAVRLQYFVDQFGDGGYFASICDHSYQGSLERIGELVDAALAAPVMLAPPPPDERGCSATGTPGGAGAAVVLVALGALRRRRGSPRSAPR